MHITRRSMLGALGAAALLPSRLARGEPSVANHLVIVFAEGGWDPSWVFDPKPESPYVDMGAGEELPFGDGRLWVDPSRPSVTEFFNRYGALSCVVNGMNVPSVAHQSCTNRVLTGSRERDRPDVGAIIGRELGFDVPMPYLDVGGDAHPGSLGSDVGVMGSSNQLRSLVLPDQALPPVDRRAWGRHFPSEDEEALIRGWVEGRAVRDPTGRDALGLNAARKEEYLLGLARSHQLPDYAAFFEGVGDGREFSDQLRIGVDALAVGLSRAVTLNAGVGFDTHTNNDDQGPLFEVVFGGLLGLMEALEGAASPFGGALIDDTLVLVLSEMGRTPLLNDDAGKDHWPFTSCLLAGAGVGGERVVGRTDETLVGEAVDFLTGEPSDAGLGLQSENVLAGVLELFGVAPEPYLPGVEVFDAFRA